MTKLTADEKALLTNLGWKEGDKVPSNFAHVYTTYGEDAARKLLENAKTNPVDADDLSFLPEEVRKAVTNATSFIEGGDEPFEKPEPKPEEKPAPKQCQNCGWAYADEADPIDDDDKRAYVAAVIGGNHVYREYSLFDGAVTIEFRSLSSVEVDGIYAQRLLDLEDKAGNVYTEFEMTSRYRAAMSLVAIYKGETTIRLPQDEAGWEKLIGPNPNPKQKFDYLATNIAKDEIFLRTIIAKSLAFTYYLKRLQEASSSPNFWKPTR